MLGHSGTLVGNMERGFKHTFEYPGMPRHFGTLCDTKVGNMERGFPHTFEYPGMPGHSGTLHDTKVGNTAR